MFKFVIFLSVVFGQLLPEGPGAGPWLVDPPELHGLNTADFLAADQRLKMSDSNRYNILVIKDGAIIHESYFVGDSNSSYQGYSVTKTIGALLAGVAVQGGAFDLDRPITEYLGIPVGGNTQNTPRNILSQTASGSTPGSVWQYDSGALVNTILRVIEATTGAPPIDLFEQRMRRQLGLGTSFQWNVTSVGTSSIGTARDYARWGQLLLNKGAWRGVPGMLVTENFVEQIVTPSFPNTNPCYGFLTWLNTDKAAYPTICQGSSWPADFEQLVPGAPTSLYSGFGANGQILIGLPEQNVVIISQGANSNIGGTRFACREVYNNVAPALGLA